MVSEVLPEHADSSQAVDWQGSQGHDAIIHFLDFMSREICIPKIFPAKSQKWRLEMRAREHVEVLQRFASAKATS